MSTTFPTSLSVLSYVDLNKQELRSAAIHNLGSAPSSPVAGQVYFNTSTFLLYVYNGSGWITWYPSTTTLNNITAPTGDVSLNSNKITNLTSPSASTDAATKGYVDGLSAGISWKGSVRAATTAAGTLATSFENGDTIDGVVLATGDRILVKNQAAGADNGIYTVNASGAPTRATDADSAAEVLNAAVFVQEGTTNADTGWVCSTNAPITLGSTTLTFVQFSATSFTYTSGVQLVGSTVSAKVDTTTITVNGSNELTAAVGHSGLARVFVAAISGNASATTFTVTHSFNTKNITVSVRGTGSLYLDELVYPDIKPNNVNSVDIVFAVAPASGVNFSVTVIG